MAFPDDPEHHRHVDTQATRLCKKDSASPRDSRPERSEDGYRQRRKRCGERAAALVPAPALPRGSAPAGLDDQVRLLAFGSGLLWTSIPLTPCRTLGETRKILEVVRELGKRARLPSRRERRDYQTEISASRAVMPHEWPELPIQSSHHGSKSPFFDR